ncbi:MAG: hypothetical protein Kow0069_25730 [Promethearchaeota archaeon]
MSLEEPDEIPSFVQSLMSVICEKFDEAHGESLGEEDFLFTQLGDFTIYKAFGFSSHWVGAPEVKLVVDDAWRDEVARVNEEFRAGPNPTYRLTLNGSIRSSGTMHGRPFSWFVKPHVTTTEKLKHYLEWVGFEPPPSSEIERWRVGRRECFEKDFVPVPSTNMIVEPALQIVGLGLIAKLARRDPALLEAFFDHLAYLAVARAKAALDAGNRILVVADDCAYKQGPMLSPALYRRFVVPRFERLTGLVHERGGRVFLHTDGWIHPLLDAFVEMGVDGVNPLEYASGMRLADVKRSHGDKLCLVGNVDTAELLPFGTPEQVRAAVRACVRDGGPAGHVFAPGGSLHHEVRLENALAMMDELERVNAERRAQSFSSS